MIYFCIPAHDEERTLGLLLWKIRTVMGEFGRDFRVLVLDDASTDETAGVLERYRSHLPLDVIRSEERLGPSRALDRLLREAVKRATYPKRDVAVPMQGDFTERPGDVVEMVKVVEGGADIVAGAWADMGRGVPRRVRLARWVAQRILSDAVADAPVSDPFCGFRAYRIIVLKKALRELEGRPLLDREGWAGQVQLLERLLPHARRVEEVELGLDYGIRLRDTRFRPLRTLWELLPLRGMRWPAGEAA